MDVSRNSSATAQQLDFASLKVVGVIEIPGAASSEFDHGIFDAKSRRKFIAHTKASTLKVVDPYAGRYKGSVHCSLYRGRHAWAVQSRDFLPPSRQSCAPR